MPLTWEEVTQRNEYQSLPDEQKSTAKEQYFNSIVAPKVPEGDIQKAKDQFDNYANSFVTKTKEQGFVGEAFKGAVDLTKKAVGVGVGVINSPLAFTWGAQEAKHLHPEEYQKLSPTKKSLVDLGGGFESAWRSISKEWDWGTLYGEYYKSVTGETIHDSLKNGLKADIKKDSPNKYAAKMTFIDTAAPTIEMLANIISDPVIIAGEAARLASLKVPKHWQGKIDPKVIAEIEKLEKLEGAEKQAVRGQLLKALKERKDYMRWWEDRLDEMDKVGPPLMRPGQAKPTTAPQQAMAGFPKRDFATKLEHEIPPTIIKEKPKPLRPDQLETLKKAKLPSSTGQPLMKPKPISAGSYTRATGGAILGVDEDEDGNLQYNLGKGLAGTLMVAGGMKMIGKGGEKVTKILSENPAWAKVHGMVGKEKKSFDFVGLYSRFSTKLLDRFSPLRDASPETYKEARVFHSHKDMAQIKFNELKDSLTKVNDSEVLFTDYVSAHRALNRAERGIANPNGVTLQDAKQAIAEIEANFKSTGKDPQILKDSLAAFQEWTNKHILQEAVDSGVLSKAGYGDIVKNNRWYATFEVLDHMPSDINKIPPGISGEYFSVSNQNIIKSMIGTEKKISDPVEATIRKFAQAQGTFAKNKVANTLIDDPGMKSLLRPVATSKKEFAIMENKGLNPVMEGAWNKKEFGAINRFKDGRVERYIADIEIAETMKQLTPWQAGKVIRAVNAVFRASATTLYLPFTISNAMRDAFMAYTTSPVYRAGRPDQFAADWAKGFWEGAKHEFLGKSDVASEYIKSGGGFGYVGDLRKTNYAKSQLFQKGMIQKSTDIITSPFKLIEKVSATIELAPRLGTFERAKMIGMDGRDAALTARKSTIDFNRGGVWTKVANQFIPFLNARVQGRLRLARSLKDQPKETLAKTFTAVVVPGAATYAWNRLYYSDLYDDIPEYIKQNYFTIITGTDKDKNGKITPKYLVISKGDVGQMAWNPLEYGLDKMWKKDRQGTTKFLVNYLSDLSPIEFAREGKLSASKAAGGLLPPIAKGFAEDWANLKFYTGKEVVPHYMGKSKPPELQYKENTPETYKWLGKKLGVAPLRLQNFASNILAGYGREGLDPSAMMRGLTGRLIKTTGGEKEGQAWTAIKDMEQGYVYTRSYADELVKNGKSNEARKLMVEWNKGLTRTISEYNKEFGEYGFEDKGGLQRSYMFTPEKMKNLLIRREDSRTTLEKRLSRRK